MDEADTLEIAVQWLAAGHRVAIGTVTKAWGSAPRPAGSHIVVREDGMFAGSVSAGCVEAAVIEEAKTVMRNGKPQSLVFGVADEQAWSVGLACGGKIEIFIELIK
jgi:xanthine/CO dehydrogenase XdhC/CoxF family maturation factor